MTKKGKIAVMDIKIKTEEILGLAQANSVKSMLVHWCGGSLISIDIQESLEEDTREKPVIPFPCNVPCKWVANSQCWFNDCFHGDFDGDFDTCFEPKNESIDKQVIIDKYWENINAEVAKTQDKPT